MAVTPGICNSFKTQLGTATHDFTITTGHAFYWALYSSAATHTPSTTTVYDNTNELAAGNGYTQGGVTVANVTPTLDSNTAVFDFSADPTWATASFTARSTLLYNSNATNAAVGIWDFGTDQTASGGSFVLELPLPTAAAGIITLV